MQNLTGHFCWAGKRPLLREAPPVAARLGVGKGCNARLLLCTAKGTVLDAATREAWKLGGNQMPLFDFGSHCGVNARPFLW
jgi:hypothetical protein